MYPLIGFPGVEQSFDNSTLVGRKISGEEIAQFWVSL